MAVEHDEPQSGWRHNPLVGGAAALVIAIVVLTGLVRLACRGGGGGQEPLDARTVAVLCAHDGEVFKVSRKDAGLPADAELDALQLKATAVPCPKCGKADGKLATTCIHCQKPYAAPTRPEEVEGFVCPHCGKRPW